MNRVMIVGGPGSGKSTLARALGAATGLPVYHMDHIHWQPGWVERTRAEKDRLTREVHARERWIFEGNHSSTYAERVSRADTLIWLDLPLGLRFYRVVWRSLRDLGQQRPDLPAGCPEQLSVETLHFLQFIWRTRHSARAKVRAQIAEIGGGVTVVHLKSRSEVRNYLARFSS